MEQASGVHERRAVPSDHLRRSAGRRAGAFSHEAFLHEGDEEFAAGGASFVASALRCEEAVLVAVRRERQQLLRAALGDDAHGVLFSDIAKVGLNPARLVPVWRRFVEEYGADGRAVHVLAEPAWPGRTGAEMSECARYEGLLNVAFEGGRAWRLVCAYDLGALGERGAELARATHPLVLTNAKTDVSKTCVRADDVRPFDGALPEPRATARTLAFTIANLHELREFVSDAARSAELSSERTENLRLAVNELASNSVRHGGGMGTVQTWCEERDLICQVSDRGRIAERLVGLVHPSPDQQSGRGLWLVNHLCDLVQIRSGERGTVVRVHVRLDQDGADGLA